MGEISRVPGDWLSQTKHPWAYYFVQPGAIFGFGITCSSQLITKSWDSLLRNDGEKDN